MGAGVIADIRGGLGTQVLELMGCYALAIERGYAAHAIDAIRINCGGESNDGAGNVLRDYISEIFPHLPAPVRVTDGGRKLGAISDPDILALVLKHQVAIRRALGFMSYSALLPRLPVLHVRRGDYQWVPLETYIEYAKAHDVWLIGNIAEDTAKVPGRNVSSSPVTDWLNGFSAPEIIGTASTFIVSMLFLNPEKRVSMFKNQEGSVFTDIMQPLLRRFALQFTNLRWID